MKYKEVQPGTVIHTEKPFVHVLNCKLRLERCDNCLARKKLLKCSGCQYVHYCGKQCQKEAWAIHKYECANIKRVSPKVVPDAARMIARIIIKLNNGGDQIKSYYTNTSFRKFKDLMSHYSDIKKDEKRMEHFQSLCAVLEEFLHGVQMPNSADLMGIFGRLCVNGFNILDPEMTTIATGIYLGASVIDHSCKPNAVAVFEGTTIYIRTISTLPSLDWNQVHICYIDLLETPKERQANLLASYYFLCQCSLCVDKNILKWMSGAICPKADCKSLVDMDKCEEKNEIFCEECQQQIYNEFINKYKDILEFTNLQMIDMKNMAYFDLCKICLQKQRGVFHNLNLLHVKTLDLAFEAAIQIGNWNYAEDIGVQLLPGYRKYYGTSHPLLGVLLLKIGKIMLYNNKIREAVKHLKEAHNIIKITHGETHTLYKEFFLPLMYQANKEIDLMTN